MAKKYLSLEEAAEVLGIDPEELNQKREKRDIRAFSDRGSWKFRPEDVENLKRSLQVDSSKEADLSDVSDDSEGTSARRSPTATPVPTSCWATRERIWCSTKGTKAAWTNRAPSSAAAKGTPPVLTATSNWCFDDALMSDGGSSEEIAFRRSPSPIATCGFRPIPPSIPAATATSNSSGGSSVEIEKLGSGSDSDVSLVGSSSDEGSGSGSDSDVQLIQTSENEAEHFVAPPTNMESEYQVNLGSETMEDSEGSSVMAGDSGLSLDDDSGIALESDSAIALESDSGLSLASDSGIALESDSGLSLASDSGISLADDSGLSLAGDSGISLAGPDDSGISLDGETDKTEAFSVMDSDSGEGHDTHLDVPAVVDEESDFEFSTNLLDTDSETSVITLDDDEASVESAVFEDSEELDFGDEGLDDEVLGSSEGIDLIGADEEHFDDAMLTGESATGLGHLVHPHGPPC